MTNSTDVANDREKAGVARSERAATLRPAVDIFENEAVITLLANLPGVPEDKLGLEVDGNTLTIQGDIQIDMPAQMESLHADVRSTRFRRAFTLSNELDTGSIRAGLNDGVLTVTIPKRKEVIPRRIEISVD